VDYKEISNIGIGARTYACQKCNFRNEKQTNKETGVIFMQNKEKG
jgi:hypothetical protein